MSIQTPLTNINLPGIPDAVKANKSKITSDVLQNAKSTLKKVAEIQKNYRDEAKDGFNNNLIGNSTPNVNKKSIKAIISNATKNVSNTVKNNKLAVTVGVGLVAGALALKAFISHKSAKAHHQQRAPFDYEM